MCKINYYLKGVPSTSNLLELKLNRLKDYQKELDKPRAIILSISNHGSRNLYSTGRFISLKQWNKENQSIKFAVDLNQKSIDDRLWLEAKKLEVEKFILQRNSEQRPFSNEEISRMLDKDLKPRKSESESLINKLEFFLANYKIKNGSPLRDNTKKKFKTLIKKHWVTFQEGEVQYVPERYTLEWVEDFRQYIVDIGCTDNTLCKYIEALKIFLRYFKDKGDRINLDFDKIKVYEYEQEINILLVEELKHLANWNFVQPTHNIVRDIFIFQCYTGARYSDIETIKLEDIIQIKEKKCWKYISKKMNDQQVTAPLHDSTIVILEKYKDLKTPLPRLSLKTMNETLKILAEIVGFTRTVKKIAFSNGVLSERYCPLHEIISTHMARKTFISISLQLGLPEQFVKAVSGHKDDRSFRKYVNLANEHLNPVSKAWDKLNSL